MIKVFEGIKPSETKLLMDAKTHHEILPIEGADYYIKQIDWGMETGKPPWLRCEFEKVRFAGGVKIVKGEKK